MQTGLSFDGERNHIVLLSQRTALANSEVCQQLAVAWGELLSELGVVGVPILYGSRLQDYFDTFPVEGIILTGGNDLAELSESEAERILNSQRDSLEIDLLKLAAVHKTHCWVSAGECSSFQATLELDLCAGLAM